MQIGSIKTRACLTWLKGFAIGFVASSVLGVLVYFIRDILDIKKKLQGSI